MAKQRQSNIFLNLTTLDFIRGELLGCFAIYIRCGLKESTDLRIPTWLLYEACGIVGAYPVIFLTKRVASNFISRDWINVLDSIPLIFTFAFVVSLIVLSGNLGRFCIITFSLSFLALALYLRLKRRDFR